MSHEKDLPSFHMVWSAIHDWEREVHNRISLTNEIDNQIRRMLIQYADKRVALLLAKQENETCKWREEDESWETGCGNRHTIIAGTPTENGMAYCCYCGRSLCLI